MNLRRRGGPTRLATSLALTCAVAALLTACGAKDDPTGDSSGGKPGVTVHAAEFTWTAAKVTNAILARIAADHPELGVAKIESTSLAPAAGWAGAGKGDIDLLTEVGLPNQQQLADKVKDKVDLLHQTYGDAAQGWFVPSYLVAPGGKAAGLTDVTQLNQFKDVFDGKLYDGDPGWITTQQNKLRLAGYGLQYTQVTSSESAELAQLKRAYDRKEPILLYLYHPHWVFAQYQMTQLAEPTPYTDGCLTPGTGKGDCAMPAYSIWTAASKDLQARAPKFKALLRSFEIPLTDMEGLMAKVDIDKVSADDAAAGWVQANKARIDTWIAAG